MIVVSSLASNQRVSPQVKGRSGAISYIISSEMYRVLDEGFSNSPYTIFPPSLHVSVHDLVAE